MSRHSSRLEEAGGWKKRWARPECFSISFPPEQCKCDPHARAWIASLENLLEYAHQCHAPASSTPTNARAAAVPAPAPPEEEQQEDPHGKSPMHPTREATGQGSNPKRRTREEMESRTGQHPRTCPAPSPVTVLDLYRLEQGPEETLHHYIWRFRGVIDRIPPADLQEISIIAVFHVNVRNLMMREKLSVRAVDEGVRRWKTKNFYLTQHQN